MKKYTLRMFVYALVAFSSFGKAMTISVTRIEGKVSEIYATDHNTLDRRQSPIRFFKLDKSQGLHSTMVMGKLDSYDDDEKVTFILPDGSSYVFPIDKSQRLLDVLYSADGMPESFKNQYLDVKSNFDTSEYPSCIMIMFYIAFGVEDFFYTPVVNQLSMKPVSTSALMLPIMRAGDVVRIHNSHRLKNNHVIYIGGKHFLCLELV